MRFDVGTFVPEQRAEAAWVAQAQNGMLEYQVHVIVLLRWRPRRHQAQTARHAEVDQQPAAAATACAVEQQILAAP
jgi:hypothetical protein